MAAIPVPVHFDGHNINIITEDSPSTCKNRVKGMNANGTKKKNKKRNVQNGKYGNKQILNKRSAVNAKPVLSPISNLSASNKENVDERNSNDGVTKLKQVENGHITVGPITSSSSSSTKALSPSNGHASTEDNHTKSVSSSTRNSENEQKQPEEEEEEEEPVEPPQAEPLNVTMSGHGIQEIELNAANMAKNPFTKRDTNSDAASHHKQSPGLPLPPRHQQQFKITPRNVGNGALKKRASPRLAAPPINNNNNNSNNDQHQQPHVSPQLTVAQHQALMDLNQEHGQMMNGAMMNGADHSHTAIVHPEEMAAMNGVTTGNNGEEGGAEDDDGDGKDRQNLYKTELCREWSTSGWCYYNKRCSFAHGLQELRPVFRSKKWRTKRCRNWHTTGYCPYEHRCQFLHDQSPPRRIQDYATANARALVAAQQRMQPLYFHYQVDCNRDETSGDDEEDAQSKKSKTSNQSRTTPIPPKNDISAHTPSIGPRLKRKNYNAHKKSNSNNYHHLHSNNNSNHHQNVNPSSSPALGSENGSQPGQFKKAALRMIQQKKMNTNEANKKTVSNAENNEFAKLRKTNSNNSNKSKKTPRESVEAAKAKAKKKKPKDAVITPFNPVQATYTPGVPSYEYAQSLGLYNQTATSILPARIPPNTAAMTGFPGGLSLHSLSTTGLPAAGYQQLPPAIDPSIYLSLTPSPPHSPTAVDQEILLKQQSNNQQMNATELNVEMPVSLTPSPPVLPINHQNFTASSLHLQVVKQQETIDELHAKMAAMNASRTPEVANTDSNAAVTALIHRSLLNKSATPVATIDGDMLESLLPTDDVDETSNTKNSNQSASKSGSGLLSKDKKLSKHLMQDDCKDIEEESASDRHHRAKPSKPPLKKTTSKNVPPIPPIPPPLQLQTSINSVVNGAVAAAMSPTGVTGLVPMTPTLVDHAASYIGYPPANLTANAAATTNSNGITAAVASGNSQSAHTASSSQAANQQILPPPPPLPTAAALSASNLAALTGYNGMDLNLNPYAAQHAYASAHATQSVLGVGGYPAPTHPAFASQPTGTAVAYGLPQGVGMQPQIGYPFLPSPDFAEISQQSYAHYTYPQ